MNIENVREYCLSLPMTSEDLPFGPDVLIFRVCGKIFAAYSFTRDNYFVLKADPDYCIDLRDRYLEIEPAWHWNKKYWNQMSLSGSLPEEFLKSLIRHSYSEVVKKLPNRIKNENPEICEIHE
ncbi:MAG: MmcQ/YjbR family DNA-binding protein [Muribaculaceae bacterium]|nr:MmcQ/YjbR family DNA-binding protein [Muribaculaceae bacterium]